MHDSFKRIGGKRFYWYAAVIGSSTISLPLVLLLGSAANANVTCASVADEKRSRCWDAAIIEKLERGQLTETLEQLDFFSKETPSFVSNCHSYAHQVGEKAFEHFSTGIPIEASAAMQVCDFGFYHGFMTSFLAESGDLTEIGRFCASLKEVDEGGKMTYSRDACYHGIGHGSVINHDPEDWENPFAILSESLKMCRAASQNEHDLLKCTGGSYNGMAYGPYLKIIDPEDPFAICRKVSDEDFPLECYANLAAVVFNLTPHKSIREAVALASHHAPPEYVIRTIPTFANMASRQFENERASIDACRSLPQDQKEACVSGYVTGLVQSENSDSKSDRAYTFCSGDLVFDTERAACFHFAFETLKDFWTKKSIQKSCRLVPDISAPACTEALAHWQ